MIEIGDKIFKTKKDATKFIQSILYKYSLKGSLNGEDLIFICDLLNLHPNRSKKIGVGIESIIVEKEKTFNRTTHFSIVRIDGSREDFSFGKCLTPSMNNPEKLFRSSARRAVADQIISFRDNYYLKNQDGDKNAKCDITGLLIGKNSSHVDHVPPKTFYKIVSDFITSNVIDINSTIFLETVDGIGREFADDNLKKNFSDYHKQIADLRIVSPLANLRQKKR